MSTSSIARITTEGGQARARWRDRRGIALAIVLGAQLMIILDMTVVNIALPTIARGLHFSEPSLSWVLNAYTLTFGGLLLLGGRAGDILGRRRVFIAGIALFTVASLAGGLATSPAWLLAARAVQGVGGAIASPAVLALITSSFAEGRDRTRALSVYTAVVMGGGSLGLVLGGVITEWVSWRWVLFVNVPIGIIVALAAPAFLSESQRQPGRFDLAGAVASTAGMTSLVYGFIRAASDGWSNRMALGAFAAAVVLLVLFVVNEARVRQPITPLRLFADRGRSGAYVSRLLLVAGMFGMFFFLTQFVQNILGFSPLRAGISFLPMTAALFAVSRLSPQLLARFGARPLMLAGLLPVVAGMAWLSRISPGSSYLSGVLGPMLLLWSRVQHGERRPAGRRVAGAGDPGHRVQHRHQERGPAPAGSPHPAGAAAPRGRARHVQCVHARSDLRHPRVPDRPGDHPRPLRAAGRCPSPASRRVPGARRGSVLTDPDQRGVLSG
jgi:EmrB/QacA subfamily drug resistance transporter